MSTAQYKCTVDEKESEDGIQLDKNTYADDDDDDIIIEDFARLRLKGETECLLRLLKLSCEISSAFL